MGVDFYACEECSEIFNDCGDEWWHCEEGHRVCKYCLGLEDGKTIEHNDDYEVYSKYCPVCQSEAKAKAREPKVNPVDTWLLVRNDNGRVLGYYDRLQYARMRRTALKGTWETTIVKVATVEGCEYPE